MRGGARDPRCIAVPPWLGPQRTPDGPAPTLIAVLPRRAVPPACRSFQSPVEIPGVSNIDFLRIATNARRKAAGDKELDPLEFYAHVMPKVGHTQRTHRGGCRPGGSCARDCRALGLLAKLGRARSLGDAPAGHTHARPPLSAPALGG